MRSKIFLNELTLILKHFFKCLMTGLPHTQETQGILKLKKTSGKLRKFQFFFLTQGSYDIFLIQGSFKILKLLREFFARLKYSELNLINLVYYFVQEISFVYF